jgi:hypothetical protein
MPNAVSNTVWSPQRENKINTVEQLKKITLNTNDVGQYQHDGVIKFIKQLKQVAKEQFNPLNKANGMGKLFDRNQTPSTPSQPRMPTTAKISSKN